nr:hypothetical protein Iba_chr07eCG5630 [Ipomoea batatas]GME15659.1 hypothetical protein Iba_scaffold16438CG0010 [Ipomoea batatas]
MRETHEMKMTPEIEGHGRRKKPPPLLPNSSPSDCYACVERERSFRLIPPPLLLRREGGGDARVVEALLTGRKTQVFASCPATEGTSCRWSPPLLPLLHTTIDKFT